MDSVVNLEKDGKKFSYNIKDIFHSINAFDADEYLQTEGYFASTMDELAKAIYEGEKRVLTEIEDTSYEQRFMSDEEDHYHYQFFLPVSKVNVIKPTYRPFTAFPELCHELDIKQYDSIYIRTKSEVKEDGHYPYKCLPLLGYSCDSDGETSIYFGLLNPTLKTLLRDFEWSKDLLTWKPFGKEVA